MKKRWAAAVHEGGHAVVAAMLVPGASEKIQATLVLDGGGESSLSPNLDSIDGAIATAAGPVAERLLSDVPPPEIEHAFPSEPLPTFAREAPFGEAAPGRPPQVSDHVWLARWAVTGHELDPESWARRHRFVTQRAEFLVQKYQAAILWIAERLYLDGRAVVSRRAIAEHFSTRKNGERDRAENLHSKT